MGASSARSARGVRGFVTWRGRQTLTLTRQAPSIDGCANDHNIIDDGETTFDTSPLSLLIPHSAVGQDGSLVHLNTLLVKCLGEGQFIFAEEFPT
jgi:hypothetical protein